MSKEGKGKRRKNRTSGSTIESTTEEGASMLHKEKCIER